MRRFAALLVTVILLVGCTTRGGQSPVDPVASPPDAAQSSPNPPAPPGQTARLGQVVADQIASLHVSARRPDHPSATITPTSHPAEIAALVKALNGAPAPRPRDVGTTTRLSVVLAFHPPGREPIYLDATGAEDPVLAVVAGKPYYIDSPGLAAALLSLEPLMKPLVPGAWYWAVDPSGKREPELLLEHREPLAPRGMDPGGRYLLLARSQAEHKGDWRAVPYLWDRSTGNLIQGEQTLMKRSATWTGSAFHYLGSLLSYEQMGPVRMGPDLKPDPLQPLRDAMGLEPRKRELVDFAVTADGRSFAALVAPPYDGQQMELVWGSTDGAAIHRVPALKAVYAQLGPLAWITLSPDGQMGGGDRV